MVVDFRFGALNVQGFADTLKLKNSIQMMEEHKLDVLFLSETKSTSYYSYISEQHLVVLSGNNRDKNAGVGLIVSPKVRPHLLDIIQVNPRIIHVSFKKQGGNLHLIGVYGPHAGLDLEEVRQPFWDQLEDHISKIPQPEPVYITGDFNVRFQARHKNDEGVTGPFTYGKGTRYIDRNASSNRSLCVNTMQRLDMVEAASYRTPDPMRHITYRDKAAPPKDWSQFLLDPLIMQQFYDVLHHQIGADSLIVAAKVRSFLEMDSLLPPPKVMPHHDPSLFQRLDHTFTRKQWLNSVNKCRSKLYTGFPSVHYLLVTEVKIKLAARSPRKPRPPGLDFKFDSSHRKAFNEIVRDLWEEELEASDHNSARQTNGARRTVFTDGSGSRGRCSKNTPAGWGWCYKEGDEWVEAFGPVVTDPDHILFRGAQVGSNNTGELTAILEAVIHAISENWSAVVVHTDSQWSINVLTGKWNARRHKTLVNYIKQLLKGFPTKVFFHWVKGHSGVEGNERADKLADEGKISVGRFGTNSQLPAIGESRVHAKDCDVVETLKEAAQQTFNKQVLKPKRPWITQQTLEALQVARQAEANQDHNSKSLRNAAKRLARKDRIAWIHRKLSEDAGQYQQGMWSTARSQKKGFQGKKRHLVVDNKPVPWSRTHQAFRDHLQNKQWQFREPNPERVAVLESRRRLHPKVIDHNSFTIEELQTAIDKLKKAKAPGPDKLVNELFMLLDDHNSRLLLEFYNKIWVSGEVPTSWKEAIVVSIYKGKGLDTDPPTIGQSLFLTPSIRFSLLCYRLDWRASARNIFEKPNTDLGREGAQGILSTSFADPWNGRK